ncbi:MAG: glycosyl hydrolase 108 family protein [Ferruginibacter sp.]
MANFFISRELTKNIEGGFWNDPSAGWTYAGITKNNYPFWPGWNRLQELQKKFFNGQEIPRYKIFNDSILENLVSDFYKNNFWNKILSGDLIKNQVIANFIYDFIVHKQNAAVGVINNSVSLLDPHITNTSKTSLTKDVIDIINKLPVQFYQTLRTARINYYQSSKHFSDKFKKAFVDRVNKFPVSIAA